MQDWIVSCFDRHQSCNDTINIIHTKTDDAFHHARDRERGRHVPSFRSDPIVVIVHRGCGCFAPRNPHNYHNTAAHYFFQLSASNTKVSFCVFTVKASKSLRASSFSSSSRIYVSPFSVMNKTPPYGQTTSTLWGPHCLARYAGSTDGIEISVHSLPRPLEREFNHVFHERNLDLDKFRQDAETRFLAIPTNQRAREDLVATGSHIEAEKDRLLNLFFRVASEVCEKIRNMGYWADFIDPCSGLPMMTPNCNKVYSEVDGMECCLGYKAHNAGFCKILTHPAWGSSVYPATMFACAPPAVVIKLLEGYPRFTEM